MTHVPVAAAKPTRIAAEKGSDRLIVGGTSSVKVPPTIDIRNKGLNNIVIIKEYDMPGLQPEDKAPDFVLPNIKGEKVSLSSQKGKWIVLVFYRGSWCPMCNTQIGNLAIDYPKFQEINAEIIAISTDTPEKAVKTKEKSHSLFPILLDEKGKVAQLYGVLVTKREWKDMPALMHRKKAGTYAMPAVFIVDPQGVLKYSYIGRSFTDRPGDEDLLKTLKELQ